MILDMTCGARLMWHQKNHPDTVYCDIRSGTETLSDGREVHINPDQIVDFRKLPFPDDTFTLVNFDPPHLTKAGNTSWLAKSTGYSSPLGKKTSKPASKKHSASSNPKASLPSNGAANTSP